MTEYIGIDVSKQSPSCITLNHRELPSLHHEEIIVKREEVAMILTSLCDQEGKEQHHGVINARETARLGKRLLFDTSVPGRKRKESCSGSSVPRQDTALRMQPSYCVRMQSA